jgi:hypothetical protein
VLLQLWFMKSRTVNLIFKISLSTYIQNLCHTYINPLNTNMSTCAICSVLVQVFRHHVNTLMPRGSITTIYHLSYTGTNKSYTTHVLQIFIDLKTAMVNKTLLARGQFNFAIMQFKQLLCWITTMKGLKWKPQSKDIACIINIKWYFCCTEHSNYVKHRSNFGKISPFHQSVINVSHPVQCVITSQYILSVINCTRDLSQLKLGDLQCLRLFLHHDIATEHLPCFGCHLQSPGQAHHHKH